MSFVVLNLHFSYYLKLNKLVVVYILKTAANHDGITCCGIAVNHDPTTRLQVELSAPSLSLLQRQNKPTALNAAFPPFVCTFFFSFFAGLKPEISSQPPNLQTPNHGGTHFALGWAAMFPAWQHVLQTRRVEMPAETREETKGISCRDLCCPTNLILPPHNARRHETHYLDGIRQHPS